MAREEVRQGLLCLLLTSEIVWTNRGQGACPPFRQLSRFGDGYSSSWQITKAIHTDFPVDGSMQMARVGAFSAQAARRSATLASAIRRISRRLRSTKASLSARQVSSRTATPW